MTESGQGQSQELMAAETAADGIRKGLPVPARDSWTEWKDRCAIGLCTGPVQNELRSFAAVHFTLYLRRYAYRTNSSFVQADLAEGEAWHLFETHLAVRNTRQGKRYKEWLFARMPGTERDDLESLAGGAALIIRDAAREHLRREYTSTDFISLNSPVQGADSAGLTLEDLLPGTMDPVDEVATREFERLAVEHAKDLIADMSRRDKIALLAKELGISLAHPEVEKAAGCRKSVLNESYQSFILGTAEKMKETYSKDDPASVRMLTLLTLREIKDLVRIWAGSSAESGRLLSIAEAS